MHKVDGFGFNFGFKSARLCDFQNNQIFLIKVNFQQEIILQENLVFQKSKKLKKNKL